MLLLISISKLTFYALSPPVMNVSMTIWAPLKKSPNCASQIGRIRGFSILTPYSKPSTASSDSGLLATWTQRSEWLTLTIYSATSNNMKLLHWPLMGGPLHLVQWTVDWVGPQPTQAPPHCTKYNSPPINGQCTNHTYCCIVVRCSVVLMCPLKG